MKVSNIFLSIFFIVSCVHAEVKKYTGSTPADPVVRSFLSIPLGDSVDFIRWQLTLYDDRYTLSCNYGISKPNTNGFINDGEKIALNGAVNKEKNICKLNNGNKILNLIELNADLLHVLDAQYHLLVGNGGWSYTLSNLSPSVTDQINITAKRTVLKDSMAFEGRTPCNVPGIIPAGMLCYKLKWYIVLYANAEKNGAGTYKVYGTPYRKQGGKTGNWKIVTGKNGRIIYQLYEDNGNGFLHLLKLDEHVLVFTDAQGKLLVGNEDFSYTMNRIVNR
ncbi:MAG TPA: hypothetical protein VH396_05555 [Chitinophagaceae bacterium]